MGRWPRRSLAEVETTGNAARAALAGNRAGWAVESGETLRAAPRRPVDRFGQARSGRPDECFRPPAAFSLGVGEPVPFASEPFPIFGQAGCVVG